jgi:hypothetical protein
MSNFDDASLFVVMDASIQRTGIGNFESLFDE